MADRPRVGIAILAGGEATRLPNKLALAAGGVPMIVRVFRNVSPGRTAYVSANVTFPPEIDALLPCPIVVDRWPRRGPLGGLLSTFEQLAEPLAFAVAADMPFVDRAFVDRLLDAWRPGDEAVVPVHGESRLEPLAALYDRAAFLREGASVLHDGDGSLHTVVERLSTRRLSMNEEEAKIFTNVNTPDDYQALAGQL